MRFKGKPEPLPLTQTGVICGYASTFNTTDADNDCVVRGAFRETLEKWQARGQWPKLLWQHKGEEPVGIWTYMAEDNYGLFVEGRIALETQQGFEAYTLIKHGAIGHLSIGFRTKEIIHDPATRTRFLTSLELYEVSLVTFASNRQARITAPLQHSSSIKG